MGEAVISSEEFEIEEEKKRNEEEEQEGEEEGQEETIGKKRKEVNGSLRNGMAVKWSKLFPRMVLRVLLVEADDSTRQIIAALLRKCSYKVVAVPDGLKAWEMLRGRPHKIDLILTEVDLPSISGYALLSLITEHEICKNIPVIMMSSQDATNTVYKCMLRGAADYLVKPIRKNELRNLWQHVWRRQSSLAEVDGLQDESVGQDKVEATSENNAASNHSSGNMACIQQNKEFIEKGSDAQRLHVCCLLQSSCTKPDAEAESAHMENKRDLLWGNFFLNGIKMQKHEAITNYGQKLVMHENQAGGVAACKDSNRMTVHEDIEPESQRMNANDIHEAYDNNHVHVNFSREAIDFMGTSASHNSSDNVKSKFDISSHLDLCLTGHNPSGFEIQHPEERCTLRISNASAFTRYSNRQSQQLHSTLETVQKDANPGRKPSSTFSVYNTDNPGPSPNTERSNASIANIKTKEYEIVIPCSQQRVFPLHIPVNGMSFNNLCTNYGSVFPPIFCKQSGASPIPSPSSCSQPEPTSKVNAFPQSTLRSNSDQLYDCLGQTAKDSTSPSLQKQDHKLDSLEDRGHISAATDHSATSSFCNVSATHLNMGYGSTSGSNSNVDQAAIIRTTSERKNEGGILHNDANSHRAIQREAALTKFRLKRKDRCYEKKVRYESRKKLAEQRPRVKGQFVRQVQLPISETEQ
ncbi:two-component response regulator-like APRR5 isoform X2 [Jatropha curcas]|uniref:two-component response regulator-like APRR5 isoform X2 n=1 Tax=Jatropha curcas TaxID=180498 RepID=UPI0009D74B45|nr:two-component response regulator-like APRR5 isoform X2 [Jatropha curcas]